jgi:triacylglycerol esterase/lipase EstA (alpha/beta hydrolase family)
MHLVVLLHGIGRTARSLKRLEEFMTSEGFTVLNVTYPSTKYLIEDLAEIIHSKIHRQLGKYNNVSFVGFSMGGLIIRAYLHSHHIPNLDKVIMVGTPNRGSPVADFLKDFRLSRNIFGPASMQLTTTYLDNRDLYGRTYYECNIIAGSLPLDFFYFLFKGQVNDGKVSVESTKLEGMKDHVVIRVPHWYLHKSKVARKLILNFLKSS